MMYYTTQVYYGSVSLSVFRSFCIKIKVQTINLSPPQIASTVSKERKNIDGAEVAQHSGVLLEGIDDGGLVGLPSD